MKRSANYTRNLLTENENLINTYNFTTITPETLSIEENIKYFSNAKIIIAPHGSNLGNMIFMQKNSHLISLFSQNFTDLFFFEWAKAAEVHFHMLNAQNAWMPQDSFTDVMITPSVLKYTIEDTLKFIDMEEKLGGKIL